MKSRVALLAVQIVSVGAGPEELAGRSESLDGARLVDQAADLQGVADLARGEVDGAHARIQRIIGTSPGRYVQQ